MNWTPDRRRAAIDIIALKLITEINSDRTQRGLIFMCELTWAASPGLNNHKELQEWLTPNDLQMIKSC